jgi:hypothetical protein
LTAGVLEQIGPAEKLLSDEDVGRVVQVIANYEARDAGVNAASLLPSPATTMALLSQRFTGPAHIESAIEQLVWEPDFYLVNEIEGFRIPKKFFPETMTPMILKLAKTWVEMCRFVLMQLGSSKRFGVGFIFSTDMAAAALAEEDESWLMLNPFKNMRDNSDGVWRAANDQDLKWLYAAAIHEATHIADGIQYHDESFARALTYNMARCADGFRKIRAIVAGIKMRGSAEADVDESDE